MSHETSIRLGELTHGERTWLLGWLNTAGSARSHIARGLAALDKLDDTERQPIAALDAVADDIEADDAAVISDERFERAIRRMMRRNAPEFRQWAERQARINGTADWRRL